MKFTKNILFLVVIGFICSASQCKKDEDFTPIQHSYFSCKINGEEFETKGLPFSGCSAYGAYYYEQAYDIYLPGYLTFNGNYCPSPSEHIGINGQEILQEGVYDLTNSKMNAYYTYLGDSLELLLDSAIIGILNITELRPRDREDQSTGLGWIEGTFEFEVTNDSRDTVVYITEGKFGFQLQ